MTRLPRIDAGRHGAPSWVDLSTPDVEAAERFYTSLFGWTSTVERTPMGEYRVASVGDRQVAGMMAQPPDAAGRPALWTVFFTVDDAEATLATVDGSGGAVLQVAFEIPGGALVGVAADPSGAMFAVISGGPSPSGQYQSSAPGSVAWVELLTREPTVVAPFYADVFGWTTHRDATTGYTELQSGDLVVGGLLPMPQQVPPSAPSHWAVYFAVGDCAATEQRCLELGGRVELATTSVASARFAVLADPHGAVFHVLESPPAPE